MPAGKKKPPPKQVDGAAKQAAEIRDTQLCRNLHLKFGVKARWKKTMFAKYAGSTAEPEQIIDMASRFVLLIYAHLLVQFRTKT